MSKNFLDLLTSIGPEKIQLMNTPGQIESFNRKNVISSGILAIDIGSGIGGYCRNRVIEIYGVEAGGKTTVALQACAQFNKEGKYAAYIDVEHAVDFSYAKRLGVVARLFSLSQPQDGEDALEIALEVCEAPNLGIIVIDSVAALMTKQELEGELTDANIGATARLMGKSLRKLIPKCSIHNTLCMFINQNRDKIGGMFGGQTSQPGGRALRYAATMRIELTRISTNKEGKEAVSNETKYAFKKNKLAPPFKEGTFNIIFGKGADNTETIIKEGASIGIIQKKGSLYSYIRREITTKGMEATQEQEVDLGRGKAEVAKTLRLDEGLTKEIWTKILEANKGKKTKSIKGGKVKGLSVTERSITTNANVSSVLVD